MDESILLVEDSPDAVELSKLALKECRTGDVIVATDGQEALDYLFRTGRYTGKESEKLPDLILLDLRLPGLNGFEVLQKIRSDRHTKYIPVVILTVSNLKSDIIKAYDLGANSYIKKSIDFEEYSISLQTACKYWLSINIRP
ncbi:MAG: response regulator [Deltaproteobacteria bacterium]|nr:response regulator [Deltaproteobacteria bacterium]